MKSTFLAKMKSLKRVGKNNEIMKKTESWLETRGGSCSQIKSNVLLEKVQTILLNRQSKKRVKSVSKIRQKSHPDQPYRNKSLYIEAQISRNMQYFTIMRPR